MKKETHMPDFTLLLNDQERSELARLLEQALSETRVEVHRTHFSPDYRATVQQEEGVIRGLLDKLRKTPVPA